jgi:translation initiation factor IF-2
VAKVRIYEIARELDLESKVVLERAQELGYEVKTASSSVEEAEIETLKAALGVVEVSETPEEPPAPEPETPQAEAAPADAPAVEPVATTPVPGADPGADVDADAAEVTESDEAPESPPGGGPTADGSSADQALGEGSAGEGAAPPATRELRELTVEHGITAAELARAMNLPVGLIVKTMLEMGEMVAANAPVPDEAAELVGEQFGWLVDVVQPAAAEEAAVAVKAKRAFDDPESALEPRPPVVTVMGHVDHGKTTLLDAIRSTRVVEGEAGGITQHIGAYQVDVHGRKITFIDTPGHAAFTAMRARGAEVTDIVILVVAANDGVMPQTAEAISHAKAAGVNIIVAINKIDVEGADPNIVRAQLTEYGLVTEELGGDTISVELSALTGQGIDQLLEMIDLVAQLEDFKANPKPAASGVVIESQLDAGRGPVATLIVQRGTLKQGDSIVAGPVAGRARAMTDEDGTRLKKAGPSTPVEVIGWSDVPTAGDFFEVVKNDREARNRAAKVVEDTRAQELVVPTARERLTALLEQMHTEDEAELRLVVKADAAGSVEAIRDAIGKIGRDGGKITILHTGVGGITENDIILADTTDSIVIGFNVRPDGKSRRAAEQHGVEIRTYAIIYELLEEIEQMLVGRLAPEEVEQILGAAEVRAVFRAPRLGQVAGSYVTEGQIVRGSKARLIRQGVVIYDGSIASLRRFKDDVREVAAGYECGIGLTNFSDVKEDDVIEAYQVEEVAQT